MRQNALRWSQGYKAGGLQSSNVLHAHHIAGREARKLKQRNFWQDVNRHGVNAASKHHRKPKTTQRACTMRARASRQQSVFLL